MPPIYAYEESIKELNDSRWVTLSVDDKVSVLQSVENEMAKRSQRFPCDISAKKIESSSNSIVLGSYSPSSKEITLNSEQLDNGSKYGKEFAIHLNTILHEGRHAYQDQAVNGIVKYDNNEELEKWKDNMKPGHYITYRENPRGYYNQPIERDARTFADEMTEKVKNEKDQLLEQQFSLESRYHENTIYNAKKELLNQTKDRGESSCQPSVESRKILTAQYLEKDVKGVDTVSIVNTKKDGLGRR